MAQSTTKITNSWSLISFAKAFGPELHLGHFTDKATGEMYDKYFFVNSEGEKTFVGYANKLGCLSLEEIAEMAEDLQIVQYDSTNSQGQPCSVFKLCKKGSFTDESINLLKALGIAR